MSIAYRYSVPTTKFFHTSYETNLAVYNAIRKAGITIPFPQREVAIVKGGASG